MPATPQPMSIYHPDAATPRRVQAIRARSSFVPPAICEDAIAKAMREHAEAEGHQGRMCEAVVPSTGRKPSVHTISHRVRLALAEGPAVPAVIAERMGESVPMVSDSLGNQRRQGMAIRNHRTGVWTITAKGSAAIESAKRKDEGIT